MTVQGSRKVPPVSAEDRIIRLKVNEVWHKFYVGHDIEEADTLAYLLREKLGLSGLKVACDDGACGACTVILNGDAVLSCMTLAVDADGRDILTIEGLAKDGPVIAAFAEQSEPGYGTAMQCGYCTPGFVMTVRAFLNENPDPTALRKELPEPVFGQIKQARGFRQFLLRGLDKVSGEWRLICAGHNLLKLCKAYRQGVVKSGLPVDITGVELSASAVPHPFHCPNQATQFSLNTSCGFAC